MQNEELQLQKHPSAFKVPGGERGDLVVLSLVVCAAAPHFDGKK